MAGPRTLNPDRCTTAELVEEALFLAIRVRQSPEAKALLPLAESMLTDARAGLSVEDKLSERQIEAEAGLLLRDVDLDLAVSDHRGVIHKKTRGKTDHKLYQRFYGAMTPYQIMRLGLRSELPIVEPWVESLKRDADPDLQDLGKTLEKAVTAGRDAVAADDLATQAMRDFRADKRAKLFDSVSAGRRSVWAELTKLGHGAEFAGSFFRAVQRRRRSELTLVEAEDLVAGAEAQLKDAQTELAAAKSRVEQAAAAEAARKDAKQALASAEAQAQALARQIASLRQQAA
ncbi:MAG TPA: hypothetical protein PKI03_36310 [Pseudomonadota bacterium]|nr:hypothetical protein [Pseudomonadota bacterium]